VIKTDKVGKVWKLHIKTLYDKGQKPTMEDMKLETEEEIEIDSVGPELLDSEIFEAVMCMKNRKAERVDRVPAQFLKYLGSTAMSKLVVMCKEIYKEGDWPNDFPKGIMIPLPKKVNAIKCSDYRTISFIPLPSKIILRIVIRRIEGKARDSVSKTQFVSEKVWEQGS